MDAKENIETLAVIRLHQLKILIKRGTNEANYILVDIKEYRNAVVRIVNSSEYDDTVKFVREGPRAR